MKANKFVKEHGWDFAKLFANGWITLNSDCDNVVSRNEVERLVKSYELVQSYGGVENATYFTHIGFDYAEQLKLRQAIADVESCL